MRMKHGNQALLSVTTSVQLIRNERTVETKAARYGKAEEHQETAKSLIVSAKSMGNITNLNPPRK